jgi:hypothetical protein
MHYHNPNACEDDSIMTQANEQLARELLQSQKTTLATCLASRHVVSLRIFPGYVGDWMPADGFRELYQNWYMSISLTGHAQIYAGKTPSWKDSSLTVRASSHSWKATVAISQLLFPTWTLPTRLRKARVDVPWVSSNTKRRPLKYPSQMHPRNSPLMPLVWASTPRTPTTFS